MCDKEKVCCETEANGNDDTFKKILLSVFLPLIVSLLVAFFGMRLDKEKKES